VFITDGFALLCPPEFAQGYLPSPLQLRGHEAVVRVGSLEAPAGELGLVMEALELLTAGVFGGACHLLSGSHRLLLEVQLHRRERLEEGLRHPGVHRIGRQVLAE
jgi:hypothetical protein